MRSPRSLQYTQELIRRASITPDDAGCQAYIAEKLASLGFDITHLPFGDVSNLWATFGTDGPVLCFAGHTDVVPPGPLDAWHTPPFEPTIDGDTLYGRGSADMKGSLGAMLDATERMLDDRPTLRGSLAFLITSDEEGPAKDGTQKVMQHLSAQGVRIDYCVIGEPSSSTQIGDVVKNGRRGSMSCRLQIRGVQGHVAYPDQADNPIHKLDRVLSALLAIEWDSGNEWFPPTSFQVTALRAGGEASNVIPGVAEIVFNLRFSSELTADDIQQRVARVMDSLRVDYDCEWEIYGHPFITQGGRLMQETAAAIQSVTGLKTEFSTSGGTSDGRFIAPAGVEVVELGPLNASIHKANENTSIHGLEQLSDIYLKIMQQLLL